MIQTIKTYKASVDAKVADLEHQLDNLNKQIQASYQGMKSHAYHLHAIITHDGGTSSGHYLVYIYNHSEQQWYRFSDIDVSKVSEEHVFEMAQGGKGTQSAYWLAYVNDETLAEMKQGNPHAYRQSEGDVIHEFNPYAKLISPKLAEIVNKEN